MRLRLVHLGAWASGKGGGAVNLCRIAEQLRQQARDLLRIADDLDPPVEQPAPRRRRTPSIEAHSTAARALRKAGMYPAAER